MKYWGMFLTQFLSCSLIFAAESMFVDFAAGMRTSKEFKIEFLKTSSDWRLVHKLYVKNFLRGKPSEKSQIPLILHHIWLGSKLPDISEHFRSTWINFNPDWVFVLWTDNPENFHFGYLVKTYKELNEILQNGEIKQIVFDTRELKLKNQLVYDAAYSYGEKSDILRYEALFEFGGLYVDTDFECLKPFDILHHYADFYAGISDSKRFSFLNGLIGASKGNRILKICVDDLIKGSEAFSPMEVINRTGPRYLTRCFFKAQSQGYRGKAIGFPAAVFYPLANWQRFIANIDDAKRMIQPYSFAIHYWHTSWFVQ